MRHISKCCTYKSEAGSQKESFEEYCRLLYLKEQKLIMVEAIQCKSVKVSIVHI